MLAIDPKNINLLALPSLPLESRRNLPEKSALYFVFDEDDEFLYIGKTVNLVKRWQGHHRLEELKQLDNNVRIAWMECDSVIMDSSETTFITHFQPLLNGATQGQRYRELIKNKILCFLTPQKLNLYRGTLSYEVYPGNRVFNGIYGERYKGFAIQKLKELASAFLLIAWSYNSETVWFWADQWLQFSTEAWEDKRDLEETITKCNEALIVSQVKSVVGVSSAQILSEALR
ncbi:GIY-YIG nuclease family protein [Chlorogloea sp. CCALA 695]|uniref:GIY-YIG nuclease family protein n=1 Tax=Chlorogloea sp. CCALA 695 TaxID=2107693 RepID=UPI000D04AA32|nr:GIY-YIG nuclease family protein [Chlorogloea sp. CCALA 695]PSB28676.1 hypothetical protein C7B70_20395 [Chlorogloea sp. CCALA 695]